jgi:OPA family glycerol-3-phosphate transporter-like MFS transporter
LPPAWTGDPSVGGDSGVTRGDRLTRWQALTATTLLVGYAGYYVCRSNLSVAGPDLVREFADRGVDRAGLGGIVSAGILSYAVGKALTGIWGDFLGGRVTFIAGMMASAFLTVLFGFASAVPVFVAIWMANRFVQSCGWSALVKVAAHWFDPSRYGTVMACLSLSFLFGDALGRFLLGGLMQNGVGWRGVFFAAAATLTLIAGGSWWTLRDSPADVGLPEPPVSAANVFGAGGAASRPPSLAELLGPFLHSPSFWAICVISFSLTLIRETFNAWTPTYLVDVYGLSQADAAQTSSIFPFIGGVSVLLVGGVSDRVRSSVRLAMTAPLLALAAVALSMIGSRVALDHQAVGLALVGSVAFLLIGPYSLLAGAMAMELGGRRGSSTAAGLIDAAGYLGAVLSGWGIGALAEHRGWTVAFRSLAAVAAGAVVATVCYCRLQPRTTRGTA